MNFRSGLGRSELSDVRNFRNFRPCCQARIAALATFGELPGLSFCPERHSGDIPGLSCCPEQHSGDVPGLSCWPEPPTDDFFRRVSSSNLLFEILDQYMHGTISISPSNSVTILWRVQWPLGGGSRGREPQKEKLQENVKT